MRSTYLVYPDTKKLLDNSGLSRRIEDAAKREEGSIGGFVGDHEVAGLSRELVRSGFYDRLPQGEKDTLMRDLRTVWDKREECSWKVERRTQQPDIREPLEEEDILMMMGWYASLVLSPQEIGDYTRFGFRSLPDFLGSVGAAVYETSNSLQLGAEGFCWESKDQEHNFMNEVGGDINCDLRITRVDRTSYPTKDPAGNQVGYRPQLEADVQRVAAYHSTEPYLLVGLLRHLEETGQSSEGCARELIDFISKKRAGVKGTALCAEHLSPEKTYAPLPFIGFSRPLNSQVIDNETLRGAMGVLGTNMNGRYGMYVGEKDELVFVYHPENSSQGNPTVAARFFPSDIKPMLENLMLQALGRRGRTPIETLDELLQYRISPEFKVHQEEMLRRRP